MQRHVRSWWCRGDTHRWWRMVALGNVALARTAHHPLCTTAQIHSSYAYKVHAYKLCPIDVWREAMWNSYLESCLAKSLIVSRRAHPHLELHRLRNCSKLLISRRTYRCSHSEMRSSWSCRTMPQLVCVSCIVRIQAMTTSTSTSSWNVVSDRSTVKIIVVMLCCRACRQDVVVSRHWWDSQHRRRNSERNAVIGAWGAGCMMVCDRWNIHVLWCRVCCF